MSGYHLGFMDDQPEPKKKQDTLIPDPTRIFLRHSANDA
jgi:hypothetical protein